MTEPEFIPDFSGDDFADDKEIQRARAERKAYEKLVQECLELIGEELNASKSGHINLKGFNIFKPLDATLKQSLKSVINEKVIWVTLVEYESAFPTARDSNWGIDQYLIGHISFNTKFPRTYIQKETLKEKIEDLFLKQDTDFRHCKKFSKKFHVVTEDKNKLAHLFQSKNLDALTDFPDLELEFFNNAALFRSSRKPISMEEAQIFCNLTKVLLCTFE